MKTKIKNLDRVAERIKLAVKNGEKIILYGDSDLDGIASLVILEEAIKTLGGGIVDFVFPDRENDGYGVNLKALEYLKPLAPALFITLDLGIGNVKEVEVANSMGFEVIVVDHHEPLPVLPNASIIVDPKQPGDDYPFKVLCNAGLTFKLCEEMLGENFSVSLQNSFLELVALATISDMVPQIEDNKLYVQKGLLSLKNTFRPGLRAFLEILGEGEVAAAGFMKIISSLNAAESINFKNESYDLLTSSSAKVAWDLAEKLIGKTNFKQQKIKEVAEEVERRIQATKEEAVIFEGDPAWRLVLAGAAASILCNKYQKPTFIYKKMDHESAGSVRGPQGGNVVEAMKTCADILISYGGHPQAAGFRVKNENLGKFKEALINYFTK